MLLQAWHCCADGQRLSVLARCRPDTLLLRLLLLARCCQSAYAHNFLVCNSS